ncbi:MAG: hypothetical protein KDA81_10800 [Planctomycetaceae bacterium]|nr:hypothetical protein [Planctomycetaceae bacterium]
MTEKDRRIPRREFLRYSAALTAAGSAAYAIHQTTDSKDVQPEVLAMTVNDPFFNHYSYIPD